MLIDLPSRPSRPLLCRNRRLCKGQALTRRFAPDACIGSQARRQARFAPFGSGFAGLDMRRRIPA
jgi:hypothetical protein